MSNSPHQFSVLFVCLGNICRSPAGEAVLLDLVERNGWEDDILVDSAGTAGYHIGKRADSRMRAAARRRGLDLQSRSRKLVAQDLTDFDLILAMDRQNLSDTLRLHEAPQAKVALLSEYLNEDWPEDVPDPYYGGDEGFEVVLDMLQHACPNILLEVRREFESH